MLYKAATVIELLGDAVLSVHGSREATFARPERLDVAGADAITFCKMGAADAVTRMTASNASVIISGPIDTFVGTPAVISVKDPRKAFIRVTAALFTPPRREGIHPSAVIDPWASIAKSAYIGPNAVIGRCEIGPRTEIHANVTLYDKTRIGSDVTIHAGSVIGADGFGYERDTDGSMQKFLHLGGVLIEDHVEIGSNTSIDRGTLGDTIIRHGVKIDNQVHIAHNCDIGEDAVVIAQSMVGGSVKIGPRAWLAPGSVVMNGIAIGADTMCGLGALVVKSVPDGETVMGNPARPLAEAKALLAAHKKLLT